MAATHALPGGIQLVRAEPKHVSEVGRICYEAFKDLSDRHGFPPDLPSAAVARQMLGLLAGRKDVYSVVALLDGEVVDRKSTRLNYSHLGISYAVFCLTKKQI